MNNGEYIPLTSIFGIRWTSFGIQLGRKGDKLAGTLYYGKEIIDQKTFPYRYDDIINRNDIVNWILVKIYLLGACNTDPYPIIKIVEILISTLKKENEVKK
jgi:hypothetical protein